MSEDNDSAKGVISHEKNLEKNYKLLIISVIILIISFLMYYFLPNNNIKGDWQIPYIYPKGFKEELINVIQRRKQNKILTILGPKGIGKTKGIIEFFETHKKPDLVPLVIDFKQLSKSASLFDLRRLLQKHIIKSLQKIDTSGIKITNLISIMPQIRALTYDSPNVYHISHSFRNSQLYELADALNQILESFDSNSYMSIKCFLEALELLRLSHQVSLVFLDYSNLEECESELIKDLFARVWKLIVYYSNHKNPLSFIIEFSNPRFLLEETTETSNSKLFVIPEFSIKEGKQHFVNIHKIFSNHEYFSIYNSYGGIGSVFDNIFHLKLQGHSFKQSMELVKNQHQDVLFRSLYQQLEENKYVSLLKKVLSKGYINIISDINITNHFLRWGVLSLDQRMNIVFSNKFFMNHCKQIIKRK